MISCVETCRRFLVVTDYCFVTVARRRRRLLFDSGLAAVRWPSDGHPVTPVDCRTQLLSLQRSCHGARTLELATNDTLLDVSRRVTVTHSLILHEMYKKI